jgi:hypothetical protein
MSERRMENRFLCADMMRVDWLKGEDEFTTVEAVLEDISALGACIQVEDRIPTGAAISISAEAPDSAGQENTGQEKPGARFSGFVSYCEYRGYGYFVGIRFSDETRWSSGVFQPQHLTNLADLSQAASDEKKTGGGESGSGPSS